MDKKRPGYIYGENKTYYEEAMDSQSAMGIVILFFAAFFFGFALGAAIF